MIIEKKDIDSGKGSIVIYHDKTGKAELEVKLEKKYCLAFSISNCISV